MGGRRSWVSSSCSSTAATEVAMATEAAMEAHSAEPVTVRFQPDFQPLIFWAGEARHRPSEAAMLHTERERRLTAILTAARHTVADTNSHHPTQWEFSAGKRVERVPLRARLQPERLIRRIKPELS